MYSHFKQIELKFDVFIHFSLDYQVKIIEAYTDDTLKSEKHAEFFLQAYTGLGDTDGLYGCLRAAQLSDSSSFTHILKLEEKWPALLALYDEKQDISGVVNKKIQHS